MDVHLRSAVHPLLGRLRIGAPRLWPLSPELHTSDCSFACPGSSTWVDKVPSRDTPSLDLADRRGGVAPDNPQVALYLPRPGRSHPLDRYARVARVAPGSDEAIVLAAMRRARFSLWRIEQRHPTTGLILRDLMRGEETWLVDETMEKNAPPGMEMAARLLQPEGFAMTARIIVPLLPDLMTLPELMAEVFTRAPALRHLQGDTLAKDARFAIGIYRAAVATGAMGRVRLQRK